MKSVGKHIKIPAPYFLNVARGELGSLGNLCSFKKATNYCPGLFVQLKDKGLNI